MVANKDEERAARRAEAAELRAARLGSADPVAELRTLIRAIDNAERFTQTIGTDKDLTVTIPAAELAALGAAARRWLGAWLRTAGEHV